jgi:hypothetical protein
VSYISHDLLHVNYSGYFSSWPISLVCAVLLMHLSSTRYVEVTKATNLWVVRVNDYTIQSTRVSIQSSELGPPTPSPPPSGASPPPPPTHTLAHEEGGCGTQFRRLDSLGYSDYDVFLENDEGSRVFRCKKLFSDTFVKHVFQNFEPFLANRA